MIVDGERQVAPTLDGVRADHLARYQWAASRLPAGARVVDVACGVGYGAKILAEAGHIVLGVDHSEDAIRYGRKFHRHALAHLTVRDAMHLDLAQRHDAAVSFETIEHLEDPAPMLKALREKTELLLASVPNEDVVPFACGGFPYHFRHYTREQFAELLAQCGWEPIEWYGQADNQSGVERDLLDGRTLIAAAVPRAGENVQNDKTENEAVVNTAAERAPIMLTGTGPSGKPFDHYRDPPEHVAILGLGPSVDQYLDVCKRLGGAHAFCDETWGINALGGVFECSRVFHMDDVRVQLARAQAAPESNIARMLEWMRAHPGPIITSRAHDEFPGLVEFPLQDFLQMFEVPYFNSTAAYCVAYALLIGVKRISIFGCDYTYPNMEQAEKGRACLEYWIGQAMARGVKVAVAQRSTLLDALQTPAERLYGYDSVDVTIRSENGRAVVDYVEKDVPTADEVEARYDHSRHPNVLVERGAS